MIAPFPIRAIFCILAAILACTQSHAEPFNTHIGACRSLASLPAHIPAPEGKLSLYTDFANRQSVKSTVNVYLINRTSRPISLSSRGGNITVDLEYLDKTAKWRRAEYERPETCGVGLELLTIDPGEYYEFWSNLPASGTKARVRFASYNPHLKDLVSNEGDGFFRQAEADAAQRDTFSLSASPRINQSLSTPIRDITPSLIDPRDRVTALYLAQAEGENLVLQESAAQWASTYEQNPAATQAEKDAAAAMRRILSNPWPARSDAALFTRCLAALQTRSSTNTKFGAPESNRPFVWAVLVELAIRRNEDPEKWKPVVDLLVGLNPAPDYREGLLILENPLIADELAPRKFLEKHLLEPNPEIQTICAQALSRRQLWKRLADLGMQLNPAGQLIVLRALAYPGPFIFSGDSDRPQRTSRNTNFDGEEQFWAHCLATQPLESAYALHSAGAFRGVADFNRLVVHIPLSKALMSEAQKGATAPEDFDLGRKEFEIRTAVELLASWNLDKDIPIFQKLLQHRGYQGSETTRPSKANPNIREPITHQQFRIRASARNALVKKGIPVDPALILEKEVPRTPLPPTTQG